MGEHDEQTPRSTPTEPVVVGRASRPLTQQIGRVAILVAGGIFALFALFNAQFVDFSWVFGETVVERSSQGRLAGGVPLILLLAVAFVLGMVVGAGLWSRRSVRRADRRARRQGKRSPKDQDD